jgi:hypothetical protein
MQASPPIPIPRDENAMNWAREVLNIPKEAKGAQVQGMLLTRLEEMDFVPASQWEQAVMVLAEEPPISLWQRDLGYEMFRTAEIALRAEVEKLAKDFFTLPPPDRHAKWRDLAARCKFSEPLTAWLEEMARGLDVIPPAVPDENKLTQEIIRYICGTFAMPPALRLALIEELLHRASGDPKEWQKAALLLRQKYPQVERLSPHLSDHLSKYVQVCKAEKLAEKNHLLAQGIAAGITRQPSKPENYIWILPVIVVTTLGLLRFLGDDHNSNKPPKNVPTWYNSRPNSFGSSPSSIPSPTVEKPVVKLKPLKPGDPPPNLPKQKVGEAYRGMLGIPGDADVYFDTDGTVIYQRKSPGMPASPSYNPNYRPPTGGIGQPEVSVENGKVIIRRKEPPSPGDNLRNRTPGSPTPGSHFPQPPQPGGHNSPGRNPFP